MRRFLLACGAIGGALFIVVFVVDGTVHSGYRPVRDTVSELAVGPGGWVQIASFVGTGVLMIGFAVGLRSARAGTWAPILILGYGLGLIVAGVFVTDPVPHSVRTGHGDVHTWASVVVFGALTAACFVLARRLGGRGTSEVWSRAEALAPPA